MPSLMDKPLKYNKECKKCGEMGLDWKQVQNTNGMPQWVLYNKAGKSHWEDCPHGYKNSKGNGSVVNPCKDIAVASAPESLKDAQTKMDEELMGIVEETKEEMEKEDLSEKAQEKITLVKLIMGKKKIKLVSAKKLYQPVFGTSGDAKYYMIARFKDMNLAVKLKTGIAGEYAGAISLRVEGSLFPYNNGLTMLGFSTQNEYRSLHLQADTIEKAKMIVGAIVGLFSNKLVSDVGAVEYILDNAK